MNATPARPDVPPFPASEAVRLDSLDAVRAFALLLGVAFHASLSFVPVFTGWAVQDLSTSPWVGMFMTVSHSFRMELFFLLAGFVSRGAVQRRGAGEFLRARLVRIGVPFVAGWFVLRPLLVSGWILGSMSLRGTVDVPGAFSEAVRSLSTLPHGIFTGTHLWFLYYLALITVTAVGLRRMLAWIDPGWKLSGPRADAVVNGLATVPGSVLLLAVPTAVVLWFMQTWGVDTPERTLWPHVPVLLLYGGCFTLGWILARRRDRMIRLVRPTPVRVVLACLGVTGVLGLGDIERDPSHPHYVAAHVAYALGYAVTLWSLVFLTLGVFMERCPRPNAAIRYVADSSYWMYLIHLPVVVWCQVAMAEGAQHWSMKLAVVVAMSVGTALFTYDLWVRSTWIGQVLNGRRQDRVLIPRLRAVVLRLGRGWKRSPATEATR